MPTQPYNLGDYDSETLLEVAKELLKKNVRQEMILNNIKRLCQRKGQNNDYSKGYRDLAECILAVIDDNMEKENE